MVRHYTPTPSAPARRHRSSGLPLTIANVLLWAGGVVLAVGLAGLVFGRTWTVAVALCSDGTGRRGAAPLWYASLFGLALAVLVAILALVLLVVSLVLRDYRVVRRSILAFVVGVSATGAGYAGVIVVFGDTPLFCF